MSAEMRRDFVGEQSFTDFTTDQTLNPRSAGVGSNVEACDMLIQCTAGDTIQVRLAGSSDQGIEIASGETLPLYDVSAADGTYELATAGTSSATVVYKAIANPTF